mmetsp:Transcript_41024/g.112906  ORF Transcript_41024/g.112906 Transcript_41024/m.112906 type:complete len:209 (+) Transcript_41024:96-722(+)
MSSSRGRSATCPSKAPAPAGGATEAVREGGGGTTAGALSPARFASRSCADELLRLSTDRGERPRRRWSPLRSAPSNEDLFFSAMDGSLEGAENLLRESAINKASAGDGEVRQALLPRASFSTDRLRPLPMNFASELPKLPTAEAKLDVDFARLMGSRLAFASSPLSPVTSTSDQADNSTSDLSDARESDHPSLSFSSDRAVALATDVR